MLFKTQHHTASVGGSFELCIHINPCICLLTVTISSDGTAIVSQRTSTLMMLRSIMSQELLCHCFLFNVFHQQVREPAETLFYFIFFNWQTACFAYDQTFKLIRFHIINKADVAGSTFVDLLWLQGSTYVFFDLMFCFCPFFDPFSKVCCHRR